MTGSASIPGLRLVPLTPQPRALGLNFCVGVRVHAEAEAGELLLLRSDVGVRVYLGAATDAAGAVVEWLELAVQVVSGLAESWTARREYLTNAKLDAQWALEAQRFADAAPELYRNTGFERVPAPPLFLNVAELSVYSPTDLISGANFRLCTDDEKLRTAGLPAYSVSLHRYWMAETSDAPGGITWVAVTQGAPGGPTVSRLEEVVALGPAVVAINPEGGLLQVRRRSPLGLDEFIDVLSGVPWRGHQAEKGPVKYEHNYAGLSDWDSILQERRHLFLGGRGRSAAVQETFHLKLQLISQLIHAVADATRRRQLPLLNITQESFRIELLPVGAALPILWGARAILAVPGQAIALPLKDSGLRHFLPLVPPTTHHPYNQLA